MFRAGLLIPLLAASVFLHAADPVGCNTAKKGRSGEVAFVESFIGTWNDVAYNKRTLTPHLSVCSDSELFRLKDGKQSAKDQLILRDLFGNDIPFICADRLNCEHSIQLVDITNELQKRLKGKTPVESFEEFKKSHTGQASTISSWAIKPLTTPSDDPWWPLGTVAKGGNPIYASALNWGDSTRQDYDLDLCLNADQRDCSAAPPRKSTYKVGAADLPFGVVPPGLHILYQVKMAKGDLAPLRTKDRAFVLAVDPSSPSDLLPVISTQLALAWMDPDATTAQLSEYISYLVLRFAKPAATQQGPK